MAGSLIDKSVDDSRRIALTAELLTILCSGDSNSKRRAVKQSSIDFTNHSRRVLNGEYTHRSSRDATYLDTSTNLPI